MTNSGEPYLEIPSVPVNFETLAGNSRTDFANAIRNWLSGASVKGIVSNQPSEFDFGTLQQQVSDLSVLFTRAVRKVRKVIVGGNVDGTIIPVTFDDIGTTDYYVHVSVITPQGDVTVLPQAAYVVSGTKTATGLSIQTEGDSSASQIEVVAVSDLQ